MTLLAVRWINRSKSQNPLFGSLVIFSDGRNNLGRNLLEVGNEYRSRGIPINVIGVGKDQPQGDLRISFSDRNPRAVAKEELLLEATVVNEFSETVSTSVGCFWVKRNSMRYPLHWNRVTRLTYPLILTPKTAGARRYRVEVVSPEGDVDPANDVDTLLVEVKPPLQFSNILYLSNQPCPLYPFIKRSLSKERTI